MSDASLQFTDEQNERLDAWYEADKPGDPWVWLGIAEAEYNAIRDAMRERMRSFMNTPTMRWFKARTDARWSAEQSRWQDDGGAVAPDDVLYAHGGVDPSPVNRTAQLLTRRRD